VPIELHPEARAELRSAVLWYEERRIGLGNEFVTEISAALNRIASAPETFPRWPGTGERSHRFADQHFTDSRMSSLLNRVSGRPRCRPEVGFLPRRCDRAPRSRRKRLARTVCRWFHSAVCRYLCRERVLKVEALMTDRELAVLAVVGLDALRRIEPESAPRRGRAWWEENVANQ